MKEAEAYARDILYHIVHQVVKTDEKPIPCYICLEDIVIGERVLRFCCDKIYHEYCLSQYAHVNQYPKCPICRRFVKRDVVNALQVVYREYEIQDARTQLQGTWDFTQDANPHNTPISPMDSPPSRDEVPFNPQVTFDFESILPTRSTLPVLRPSFEDPRRPVPSLPRLGRRPAISFFPSSTRALQEQLNLRQQLMDHIETTERSASHIEDLVNRMLTRYRRNFPY
mgnify:CR=1 FL=1